MCQSNCQKNKCSCCSCCCRRTCCRAEHCYHIIYPTYGYCGYGNVTCNSVTGLTATTTTIGPTTYECCRCGHRYVTPSYSYTITSPNVAYTLWNTGTTISGNVNITGNLTVGGTTTTGQIYTGQSNTVAGNVPQNTNTTTVNLGQNKTVEECKCPRCSSE